MLYNIEHNRVDARAAIKNLIGTLIESDLVRKVGETFATRVFLIGVGLVTSVIAARILGPEGRGIYGVAVAVGAIGVQFGNLGLHASNTYYVARDRGLLPSLTGNTFIVSFLFGGLCAAIMWVFFMMRPDMAPVNGPLLIMALAWIPFGLAYMLSQNLLLGLHEVRAYNKIELAYNALTLCLIGAVALLGAATVESVFAGGLLALVVGLAFAVRRLRAYIDRPPLPSLRLFKENFRYGFKAYLAAFFAFLVLRVDLLMVKYMLGAEQAGYYSIAVAMADMVFMLPVVIGTILFPRLSAMADIGDKLEYTKTISYSVSFVMLILVAVASLIAKPVVQLLYGEEFIPAVLPFVWLMPGIFVLSVNVIYMNYFASTGMPPITIYSPVAASILNIILNMKLIPWMGIVGASVSSSLSYGLMFGFSGYILFQRRKAI